MIKKYDIIIPTKDSSAHLEIVAKFYKDKNLTPLFIVDKRTCDNTREIIQKFDFRFLEFLPNGNFPEAGMIEFGTQNCEHKWILRLDDDELPSQVLLDWIEKKGINSKNQGWFLTRKEIYRSERGIVYSRSPGKYPIVAYPDKLQPMARLFHLDRVKYREEVHTTGFEDFFLYSFAPQEAFFIHLNCLIHGMKKRLAKLEEYETIAPETSWELADEYLPELFDEQVHNPSNEGLDEFKGILGNFVRHIDNNDTVFISHSKKEMIRNNVFVRIDKLKIKQNQNQNQRINCDADIVAWIDVLPLSMRWTLAKFLCSFGRNKIKQYGMTMWDYINFYTNS